MKKLACAIAIVLALGTFAKAQSSPNLIFGQVPTAAQWNSYFAAKQDVLGFTPLNRAGDTMGGPLNMGGSTISNFSALSPTSLLYSRTAPVATAACTSPAIPANNGSAAFTFNVGTTCTGISTATITLPAATTGWVCQFANVTNPATSAPSQTGGTTTTVTFTNYVRTTGVAGDWTDSDVLRVSCMGY